MNARPVPRAATALCALLLAAAPAALRAQDLADPTRPAGPAGTAERARAASSPNTPPRALPQLQSLQIPAQGPASALLDGRVVRVGDRVGELTVVAIDGQGILMRAAHSEKRIPLVTGITKSDSGSVATPRTALAAASKETQ